MWLVRFIPKLDHRSLALFRITLGVVLLCDLFIFRIANLEAFYSDDGITPRELAREIGNSDWHRALVPWSPLFWNGSQLFAGVFFSLTGIAYTAYLVGWKTRAAGIASFIFLLSIHHRCSMIIETDDHMLLCMVFWSLFLPLDGHLSLRKWKNPAYVPVEVSRLVSLGLLVQIALIYFCNGYQKVGTTWTSGVAVNFAVMDDLWIRPGPANWLTSQLELCEWMTRMTRPFELTVGLMILSPSCWNFPRTLAAFAMTGFHWGIAVFLSFGFLPLIATAWALALLPGNFWLRFGWKSVEPHQNRNRKLSWLRDIALAIVATLFVIQSLHKMTWQKFIPGPLGKTSLFMQNWLLYVPDVNTRVGWIQLQGVTADGDTIELRSRQGWTEDGSALSAYRYECWQNFIQYQLYRNYKYTELASAWLDWEVKRAQEDGLDLQSAQLIVFRRRILGVATPGEPKLIPLVTVQL